MKLPIQPGYSDDFGDSNRLTARADDFQYFMGNGNGGRPRTVNSRIANVNGIDYEKLSSQQALKRTLPASLQPLSPSNKSNLVESVNNSQTRDIYGNTYHPAESSLINSRGYTRDHFGWGNNEETMMYENNGSRILPASFIHGKSISSTQFPVSSDPAYRSMVGEERVAGNDERLIYQAALEVFLGLTST